VKEYDLRDYISNESREPTGKVIQNFRDDFSDSIILSDQFLVILAITEAREAVQVEGYFESEEDLEKFAEFVNGFGVNCYFDLELEDGGSTVDSISSMIGDEDAKKELKKFTESALKCNVFMDRGDSNFEEVKRIRELKENGSEENYHRVFGEFLNYPEQDIKSFIFDQKPEWRKKVLRLLGLGEPPTITAGRAVKKYSDNLSMEEKRTVNCFTDHVIRDSGKSFQRAVEIAQKRRNVLKHYTDVEKLLDDVFY